MTVGGVRVLAAGSANMDVVFSSDRLPVMGESLFARELALLSGGKGVNRAVALSRLGASVRLLCRVGEDAFGQSLRSMLRSQGVDDSLIQMDPALATGAACVLRAGSGNAILVAPGANENHSLEEAERCAKRAREYDVLSMDLEFSPQAARLLCEGFVRRGVPVVADLAPVRPDVELSSFRGAYVLSPNQTEAKHYAGAAADDPKSAGIAARILRERSGAENIVIKLGEQGALLFDGWACTHFPAHRTGRPAVDTTGAGDCFMASLCFHIARGLPLGECIRLSNVAAAMAVAGEGAIAPLPTWAEVRAELHEKGMG